MIRPVPSTKNGMPIGNTETFKLPLSYSGGVKKLFGLLRKGHEEWITQS